MALTQVTSIGLKDGEIVNADLHSAASVALSKLASTGALGSAVTATTQSASDDSTKLATTAFVQAAVTSLIDGAPGSLNTLNELAAAINDDSSYATTLTTALATKAVLTGSTNNTITTVTGANAIQGEANLTFDGSNLAINGSPPWSVAGGDYRNLSISGEIANSGGFLWLGNGTATTNGDFDLGRINFCNGANIVAQITGTTDSSATDTGRLDFYTRGNGESSPDLRLRITSGGKFAINGSFTPSARVEIRDTIGGGGGTGLILNDVGSSGANEGLHIEWRSGSDKQSDQVRIGQSSNGTGSGSNFFVATNHQDSGSSTERLRIFSDGRVQIGGQNAIADTSLTHRLLVRSQNDSNAIAIAGRNGDHIGELSFYQSDASTKIGEIEGHSTHMAFFSRAGYISFHTGGTAEKLRLNSDGRLFLGSGLNSNADTYKMSIKESSSENAAIMFLDTDNMKGGLCGISKGNNDLISGTSNVDFVVGSLYADTHIVASPANVANTVIAMTVQHDRIQLWENVLISNNVVLTGNTNSNIINERVQILPSENNGYDDSHILSAVQTSGNWEQGNSSSNPSSSWGWIWQYANANNGTKQVRSGIAYDHKGSEEFKYWSSYGDHTWYVDSNASGDETAETCDKKAMQICRQGSVINTANPTYGIYTHTGVQTSDGGSKTVQYLEDCMGQWIVVAKIQQASHLQAAMASVAQIDTSINHNTGTEWSSSFGTTYPIAVRYVSSSNWKNWRDHRGVDFIQGVPHGRQWRHFFTNGASSGMTTATGGVGSTKYGWTCDGCWDGKGRWHNPTFNWWRMSDHGSGFSNDYVSASFFTTPTAANASTALNLNWANDAKFGVHHSGATGGQDTEVTSVYGWDDNTYGHEDNYPNSPSNNSGSDIGAMNLWICINVSAVGQFH